MKIELNDKEVLKLVDKNYLTELIANKIITQRTDSLWQEFDKELLKSLEVATKQIVSEYMKDYYSGDVEGLVRNELRRMTKEDIINIMTGKSESK